MLPPAAKRGCCNVCADWETNPVPSATPRALTQWRKKLAQRDAELAEARAQIERLAKQLAVDRSAPGAGRERTPESG